MICADALTKLVLTDGFVYSLGWLLSLAMVIGVQLDEGSRELKLWMIAIGVYVVSLAALRIHYFSNTAYSYCTPVLFDLFVAFVYLVGLLLGWLIARMARIQVHKKINNHKEVTNGH